MPGAKYWFESIHFRFYVQQKDHHHTAGFFSQKKRETGILPL